MSEITEDSIYWQIVDTPGINYKTLTKDFTPGPQDPRWHQLYEILDSLIHSGRITTVNVVTWAVDARSNVCYFDVERSGLTVYKTGPMNWSAREILIEYDPNETKKKALSNA